MVGPWRARASSGFGSRLAGRLLQWISGPSTCLSSRFQEVRTMPELLDMVSELTQRAIRPLFAYPVDFQWVPEL